MELSDLCLLKNRLCVFERDILMTLPNAPIERIIRKAGAERVSDNAVDELREALQGLGEEVAVDANKMAEHADRNTVKKEDVKLATK